MADATQLLKQDHRKVEALFKQYDKGDTSVVTQICNELKVHTAIEEQVLYPMLSQLSGGQQLRQEAEREHQEVKDAIARIERSESAALEACMRAIIDGVTHHVQEEEHEVFPKMESELGRARMTELGEQLMEAKRRQLVATDGIVDLSKDELYELAQGTGIEGRSDMDKDELIAALRS